MDKRLFFIFVLLILLTLATVLVSGLSWTSPLYGWLLLLFAGIKFSMVAFEFMELKKAHRLWKFALGIALGFFILLVILIK